MSQWRPGQKEAVLEAAKARGMVPNVPAVAPSIPASVPVAIQPAKGRPRGRAPMNKTERSFANRLEAMVARGDIHSFEREGITLRWPDGMTYTPDFAVVVSCGGIQGPHAIVKMAEHLFIETKGPHIREDALVKFRAARAHWPLYRFEMWQLAKGEWTKLL